MKSMQWIACSMLTVALWSVVAVEVSPAAAAGLDRDGLILDLNLCLASPDPQAAPQFSTRLGQLYEHWTNQTEEATFVLEMRLYLSNCASALSNQPMGLLLQLYDLQTQSGHTFDKQILFSRYKVSMEQRMAFWWRLCREHRIHLADVDRSVLSDIEHQGQVYGEKGELARVLEWIEAMPEPKSVQVVEELVRLRLKTFELAQDQAKRLAYALRVPLANATPQLQERVYDARCISAYVLWRNLDQPVYRQILQTNYAAFQKACPDSSVLTNLVKICGAALRTQ